MAEKAFRNFAASASSVSFLLFFTHLVDVIFSTPIAGRSLPALPGRVEHLVAREAHNLEVAGSSPASATKPYNAFLKCLLKK